MTHFVAGRLSAPESDVLRAHLAGCTTCQRALAERERTTPEPRFAATVCWQEQAAPQPRAAGTRPGSAPASADASDSQAGPLSPGMQVGEYEVLHQIGAGGMGEVYAAVHPVIGKRAAVKVIAPRLCKNQEAIRRFRDEARAVNEIGSRHIVDVFSFGTLPDGRLFQIMELLEGEPLETRLQRGAMEFFDALALFDQVLAAVMAAHARQVVHRDLKPDNVFLVSTPEGTEARLLDFGIAKLVGDPTSSVSSTAAGLVLGTPMYMSPEQARGANVGPAADIYALGAVLMKMVSGRPPFLAATAAELMAAHITEPPPGLRSFLPTAPAKLDALLRRMLAKSPDERPSIETIRSVIAELRTLGDAASLPASLEGPRISRIKIAVAVVSIPALVAVAVFFLSRGEGASSKSGATAAEPKPEPAARAAEKELGESPASERQPALKASAPAIAEPADEESPPAARSAKKAARKPGPRQAPARSPAKTKPVPAGDLLEKKTPKEPTPENKQPRKARPVDRDAPIADPFQL